MKHGLRGSLVRSAQRAGSSCAPLVRGRGGSSYHPVHDPELSRILPVVRSNVAKNTPYSKSGGENFWKSRFLNFWDKISYISYMFLQKLILVTCPPNSYRTSFVGGPTTIRNVRYKAASSPPKMRVVVLMAALASAAAFSVAPVPTQPLTVFPDGRERDVAGVEQKGRRLWPENPTRPLGKFRAEGRGAVQLLGDARIAVPKVSELSWMLCIRASGSSYRWFLPCCKDSRPVDLR